MRTSFRGILSRVERLPADIQTRHGDMDPDELVRLLREGRCCAASGDVRQLTDAESQERARALRQAALRDADIAR